MGSIGYEVARLAHSFNAKIIYYKRSRLTVEEEKTVAARYVDLDTLLSEADIISLHCPLTEETRNIISASELTAMKQGAILVNTSRGGLINEKALTEAVESGRLGGVALDVFDPEPPVDSPLLSSGKLVVSPHISGISYEWFQRAFQLSGENMARVIRGEKPVNIVY